MYIKDSFSQIITSRRKIISIRYNTEDLGQENSLYMTQLQISGHLGFWKFEIYEANLY